MKLSFECLKQNLMLHKNNLAYAEPLTNANFQAWCFSIYRVPFRNYPDQPLPESFYNFYDLDNQTAMY